MRDDLDHSPVGINGGTRIRFEPEILKVRHRQDRWVRDVRYDVRNAFRLGVLYSTVLALTGWFLLAEGTSDFPKLRSISGSSTLEWNLFVISSILIGMCLGSMTALVWTSRRRLRAVMRPNLGRVISAIVLALLTPAALFGILPIPFLLPVVELIAEVALGNWPREMTLDASLFVVGVVLPLTYTAASLIISGVRSRWVRVALFGQIWLAIYSLAMLVFGCCIVNL